MNRSGSLFTAVAASVGFAGVQAQAPEVYPKTANVAVTKPGVMSPLGGVVGGQVTFTTDTVNSTLQIPPTTIDGRTSTEGDLIFTVKPGTEPGTVDCNIGELTVNIRKDLYDATVKQVPTLDIKMLGLLILLIGGGGAALRYGRSPKEKLALFTAVISTGAFQQVPDTYAAPTSQMTSTFRAAATDPNAAIKEIVVTVDNRTGIASYSIQRNPNCKLTPLPVNNPPVFPNISPISVTTGTAGNQTLPPASDPDGDTITYSVSTLPPGFTFSTSTRVLSWTANTGVATNSIDYTAKDSKGATTTEKVSIEVKCPAGTSLNPDGTCG